LTRSLSQTTTAAISRASFTKPDHCNWHV
jgi:hypothetical protein